MTSPPVAPRPAGPGPGRLPVPPWTLAVTAMLSVQLGSALSVRLIATVGAAGTAWLRLTAGALILLLLARPPLRQVRRPDVAPLLGLGVTTGLITMCFLAAIDRIPLGTAVAVEFLGPLTVATTRSHSRRALGWPALAACGVALLTEPWHGHLDLAGLGFAALAAVGWGTYIVLTRQVGDRFDGISGLTLTIPVAALTTAPLGIPQAAGHLGAGVLAAALGLAVLLPVLPLACEMVALRHLTPLAFGTLMALEPAIGTTLGFLILHQSPTAGQVLGVTLVVLAGAGAQRGGRRTPPGEPAQEPAGDWGRPTPHRTEPIVSLTADVVVVGAGIVGSSTALELARRGLDVLVVDKAGAAGMGSTSASSGVIRFNYSTWAGVAIAWESKFRWEAWEEHLGFRDPGGMARYHRCGKVVLDVPVVSRQRMAGLFERAGIPYEEWDAQTLAARIPGIDTGAFFPPKRVDSEEFFADPHGSLGAIYTPDGGYVDDTRLAAANLAAAAAHHGARFAYRRTVTGLTRTGDTWRVALDGDETAEAPVVVNGAGPWSSRVNTLAGAGADFTIGVAPMRQEVHHVPAPAPLLAPGATFPAIADMDLGTYMRPESGGHLLVGGTEPECDPLEWVDDPDAVDVTPSLERFEAQVTRAARRFPDLTVPNRPRGIAGVYDVADDWTPIYDRTALPGFYVAIGTSGNQFKNAPIIGSLMSTLIEAVENGHDHDADPVHYTCPHTGHDVDLGTFSRMREVNAESSGTVMG